MAEVLPLENSSPSGHCDRGEMPQLSQQVDGEQERAGLGVNMETCAWVNHFHNKD